MKIKKGQSCRIALLVKILSISERFRGNQNVKEIKKWNVKTNSRFLTKKSLLIFFRSAICKLNKFQKIKFYLNKSQKKRIAKTNPMNTWSYQSWITNTVAAKSMTKLPTDHKSNTNIDPQKPCPQHILKAEMTEA